MGEIRWTAMISQWKKLSMPGATAAPDVAELPSQNQLVVAQSKCGCQLVWKLLPQATQSRCMASHRSSQWVRARGRFQDRARQTRATLQFFSCAAPCPRKRQRGFSRKTPPLWCTSFPIVPASLDGTTKFSMRVSINNFIGPIDFFSLLVRF